MYDEHGSFLGVGEERELAQGSYQSFSGQAGHLEAYREQEHKEWSPEMSRSDSEGKSV